MKKKIITVLLLLCLGVMTGCTDKEVSTGKNNAQEEKVKTFDIETVYGNLTYPEQWKNQLRIEQQADTIQFWGTVEGKEEKLLFTLEFAESKGYRLGSLDGEDIFIVDGESEFGDDWSDEEKEQIISMQEDFNVILDGLMGMENFQLAK